MLHQRNEVQFNPSRSGEVGADASYNAPDRYMSLPEPRDMRLPCNNICTTSEPLIRSSTLSIRYKRRTWNTIDNPLNLKCIAPPSKPEGLSEDEIQYILLGGFWRPSAPTDVMAKESANDIRKLSKFAQYQMKQGTKLDDEVDDRTLFAFQEVSCCTHFISGLWIRISVLRKNIKWKSKNEKGVMFEPLLTTGQRHDSAADVFFKYHSSES